MITILGSVPSKSNLYRIGRKGLFKTPSLKKYEESFYWQLPAEWRNKNIGGIFEFHINVYYPSKRADLDNSLKVCLDLLQQTKTIKNDNNCCKIVAQKFIDKNNPRVEFDIVSKPF